MRVVPDLVQTKSLLYWIPLYTEELTGASWLLQLVAERPDCGGFKTCTVFKTWCLG